MQSYIIRRTIKKLCHTLLRQPYGFVKYAYFYTALARLLCENLKIRRTIPYLQFFIGHDVFLQGKLAGRFQFFCDADLLQ